MKRRRGYSFALASAVVVTVLAGELGSADPTSADPTSAISSNAVVDAAHSQCVRSQTRGELLPVDAEALRSGGDSVVIDAVTFAVGPSGWRHSKVNALAAAVFDSGGWLWSVYGDDYQGVADRLVEQAIASPDPGDYATRVELKDSGWNESAMSRRLGTVVCAYSRTRDVRLEPLMDVLVAGLSGRRYYGPPYRRIHNHGLFANLAIYQAGIERDNQSWQNFSAQRMRREAPRVFAQCGMVGEQSSAYQLLNYYLWREAIEVLGSRAPGISAQLARAAAALGALGAPDGTMQPVGDGFGPVDSSDFPYVGPLWCPLGLGSQRGAGWAAARMDLVEGSTQHIVRFGPAPSMHGHDDRGAMTWWVSARGASAQVLSDRGNFDKNAARAEREDAPANHSVLVAGRTDPVQMVTAQRAVTPQGNFVYDLLFEESEKRSRIVTFSGTRTAMSVLDTVRPPENSIHGYVQHWQLAPRWVPTGVNTARRGRLTLHFSCEVNGVATRMVPVRTRQNLGFRRSVGAWDMQCRASAAGVMSIKTALRVTG